MRVYLAFALAGVTLFAIGACGNSRRAGPEAGPAPVTTTALAEGRQVFQRNCYQCHPAGQAGLGPALNNKPIPRFLMATQVRQGVGAMPGFDKQEISDLELDHLLDYMAVLRDTK
jgi:mono/diheme cytochrome c family protein